MKQNGLREGVARLLAHRPSTSTADRNITPAKICGLASNATTVSTLVHLPERRNNTSSTLQHPAPPSSSTATTTTANTPRKLAFSRRDKCYMRLGWVLGGSGGSCAHWRCCGSCWLRGFSRVWAPDAMRSKPGSRLEGSVGGFTGLSF